MFVKENRCYYYYFFWGGGRSHHRRFIHSSQNALMTRATHGRGGKPFAVDSPSPRRGNRGPVSESVQKHQLFNVLDTCHHRGASVCFCGSSLEALRTFLNPKTDLLTGQAESARAGSEVHGLGVQNTSTRGTRIWPNFRPFWVKETRHAENAFARKRYILIQFPTILV